MSLRRAVAVPFRQRGVERMTESEFVVALSLDRDWFSPDQAKRVVTVGAGEGLLDRTDDRPYPRRYASIRRCVQDLASRDGPRYVTVRGRDVESGDPRTVAGRIVDVTEGHSRVTASLTVRTDDGDVAVGGGAAAFEDVEATELVVGTDAPPSPSR